MPRILCPAGQEEHPVLSRNDMDVQCRIEGGLRPAKGSPCCGDYLTCRIWRITAEIERGPSTKKQRDETRVAPKPHTLTGRLDRERITA